MAQQVKLDELKALLEKYTSQAQGYGILQWAKSQLAEGDDRFLNDMLNQLRMRDSAQRWRPIWMNKSQKTENVYKVQLTGNPFVDILIYRLKSALERY
jgi:hypothetical protein